MNPTYTFVGGDGRQYGPHPLETIQDWIREGRLLPDTQMARSDVEGWFRAGDFQEFNWAGAPSAGSEPAATGNPVRAATASAARPVSVVGPAPGAAVSMDAAAMAAVRSRASWFYWIAGLTAVNVGLALGGSATRFVVGTALADIFMAIGQAAAGMRGVAVVLSVLLIGSFVLFGVFAGKAHRWAFILGIVLYAGDAVLCVIGTDWLSLAFHAWAIWRLVEGLRIAWAMQAARRV